MIPRFYISREINTLKAFIIELTLEAFDEAHLFKLPDQEQEQALIWAFKTIYNIFHNHNSIMIEKRRRKVLEETEAALAIT